MNKIEVKVLNPEVVSDSIKMMVTAARMTQRGHQISNLEDFNNLYNKSFTKETIEIMSNLPHPTIQKFGVINVVVVGASRRFLAQITRHQNEVKFMSGSLQYSNYKDGSDFVVPYEILCSSEQCINEYTETCRIAMNKYKELNDKGVNNDSCGYMAPQSLRNVLIISATPYQWKHMISQRICKRNTDETRYVMLLIWKQLYKLSPELFSTKTTGPFCCKSKCLEGKMSCGKPLKKFVDEHKTTGVSVPRLIINDKWPLLKEL